ncbi:uncharacterized protein LOC143038689 isoform X2 [Oratosquilla oratoria]|uniref:uncharacterized protein LOC143038689 isoform X2 n=1 Tax=Oratosquilla oratoria TaxID=337810 RepID=UPI003F770C87
MADSLASVRPLNCKKKNRWCHPGQLASTQPHVLLLVALSLLLQCTNPASHTGKDVNPFQNIRHPPPPPTLPQPSLEEPKNSNRDEDDPVSEDKDVLDVEQQVVDSIQGTTQRQNESQVSEGEVLHVGAVPLATSPPQTPQIVEPPDHSPSPTTETPIKATPVKEIDVGGDAKQSTTGEVDETVQAKRSEVVKDPDITHKEEPQVSGSGEEEKNQVKEVDKPKEGIIPSTEEIHVEESKKGIEAGVSNDTVLQPNIPGGSNETIKETETSKDQQEEKPKESEKVKEEKDAVEERPIIQEEVGEVKKEGKEDEQIIKEVVEEGEEEEEEEEEGESVDVTEKEEKLVEEEKAGEPDASLLEEKTEPLETYSQFAKRVNAEKQHDALSNGHTNGLSSTQPKTLHKLKKNHASPDCGSKLVAANPEATHAHKVIASNKDEYLLNKCGDKTWFVIELCESIRPQQFDIANFELFSNLPQNITVHGSHRYPSREWTLLGRYEGQEGNRALQTFDIEASIDFFKFIKVEVLSHYGTEFFCPISLFRIYGLSEFEVLETEDAPVEEEEDLEAAREEEKEAAFDATASKQQPFGTVGRGGMADMLKNVLSGVLDVIKRGYRPGNSTSANDPDNINEFTAKCRSLHPSQSVEETDCPLASSLNYILACYYDEYQALIKLPVVSATIENSTFCQHLGSTMCSSPSVEDSLVYDTACNDSYVCVMLSPKHVLAMCFMYDPLLLTHAQAPPCETDTATPENASVHSRDYIMPGSPSSINPRLPAQPQTGLGSSLPQSGKGGAQVKQPPKSQKESTKDITGKEETNKNIDPNSVADVAVPSSPEESVMEQRKGKEVKPKSKQDKKKPDEHVGQVGLEVGTGSTLPPGTHIEGTLDEKLGEEGEEVPESTLLEESTVPQPNTTKSHQQPQAPPQEPKVSQHSASNKESIVVRLSNKIKALESNMSISSAYLEELSRRYKRQMEEMQKQFNATIAALNETSRHAYERDLQHQQDIATLEELMTTLRSEVDFLLQERRTLANTVVEQHLLLMLIEVVVLSLVFYMCGWRHRHKSSRDCAHTPSYDGPLALPPSTSGQHGEDEGCGDTGAVEGTERSRRTRRRSIDSITRERLAKPRQRRPSEEALNITGTYQDLLIVEPAIPIMVDPICDAPTSSLGRKKKKKSSTGLKRSKSNASISEKEGVRRVKKTKDKLELSSAGVLFVGQEDQNFNSGFNQGIIHTEPSPVTSYVWQDTVGQSFTDSSPTTPIDFIESLHRPLLHNISSSPLTGNGYSDFSCGSTFSYGDNSYEVLQPKRHSIACCHNCETVQHYSPPTKSPCVDPSSTGLGRLSKTKKIRRSKSNPTPNHGCCCCTEHNSRGVSFLLHEASHHVANGHHEAPYTVNGHDHDRDKLSRSISNHGDSRLNGLSTILRGPHEQDIVEHMFADDMSSVPPQYERSVICNTITSRAKTRLRSDNWEWYASQQHQGSSSSETISTCSSTDSNGRLGGGKCVEDLVISNKKSKIKPSSGGKKKKKKSLSSSRMVGEEVIKEVDAAT